MNSACFALLSLHANYLTSQPPSKIFRSPAGFLQRRSLFVSSPFRGDDVLIECVLLHQKAVFYESV
jgi:hypothetical protein